MDITAPAQIITAPAQLLTAPSQPPATGATVYTALFFRQTSLSSIAAIHPLTVAHSLTAHSLTAKAPNFHPPNVFILVFSFFFFLHFPPSVDIGSFAHSLESLFVFSSVSLFSDFISWSSLTLLTFFFHYHLLLNGTFAVYVSFGYLVLLLPT